MIDKNHYIKKENGNRLYVNILENSIEAINVIYIQTPIGSVAEFKECYKPLGEAGFNVFAIDLSGVGESEGEIKNFSTNILNEDINILVEFIKNNYNENIHFFGGSGIGGILGQYYVSGNNNIKSFVQYGLAIYKDISIYMNPVSSKIMYPILKVLRKVSPNLKLKFTPNKFNGKNAEKENDWYKDLMKKKPGVMDMNISVMCTLFDIFLHRTSSLKNKPSCPTLVFAPKHDRYFSNEYIRKYYDWIEEPKSIYEIDDSHLSFLWHADIICKKAGEWFEKNS